MEKFKITKADKEMFFLKIGEIIYIDFSEGRVYAEDKKQYMPLSMLEKINADGVRIKED